MTELPTAASYRSEPTTCHVEPFLKRINISDSLVLTRSSCFQRLDLVFRSFGPTIGISRLKGPAFAARLGLLQGFGRPTNTPEKMIGLDGKSYGWLSGVGVATPHSTLWTHAPAPRPSMRGDRRVEPPCLYRRQVCAREPQAY